MLLEVIVPDLLLPPEAPASLRETRLPALERWLARADTYTLPAGDATGALAARFSLPDPVPVAAITLAADVGPEPGTWLRADPVHLRIERDWLTLHDPSVLDVSREEALQLTEVLQGFFAADGLRFLSPTPERWYVRVPEGESPRTVPLDEALGRNVFGMLPRGEGRINWPSAITEVQMLFAEHDVNTRREGEGRPAINSVWFWGEGPAPQALRSPYAMVYADDAFARGLAAVSRTRVVPVPAGFDAIDAVAEGEAVLLVLDGLRAPRRRGDEDAWKRAAARLDDDWFARLAGAFERFDEVRVLLPRERDTLLAHLTPRSRWRLLRRGKPLSHHA